MQATRGAVVSFNYTLKDDEGHVIDTNEDGKPLEYLHGYDNIIPGLEKALDGEEPGFRKEVVVEPEEAYGTVDPEDIFEIPRSDFPEDMKPEKGMQVLAETESGEVPLIVVDVKEDKVVVDANHPLAGKRLHFEVEVVDVRPASNAELAEGAPQE
jgi:FKBP-type peptidyl-prolyl cis-trans isomerase SlyD